MNRTLDYDSMAGTYDRRYERNLFAGVERTLLDFVGSRTDGRVLEVGCGTGHWVSVLERRGFSVAGVDASREMLLRSKERLSASAIVCGRAEQLSWKSQSFQRLVCINAFHHFLDKEAFLNEAHRVLRDSGSLMIVGLDPHTGLDQWFVYDYFETVLEFDRRRYTPTHEIRELMRKSGFDRCGTIEAQHEPFRIPARRALEQGWVARTAVSQLATLTDADYEHGISRIQRGIEDAEARGEELELAFDIRLYATIGAA